MTEVMIRGYVFFGRFILTLCTAGSRSSSDLGRRCFRERFAGKTGRGTKGCRWVGEASKTLTLIDEGNDDLLVSRKASDDSGWHSRRCRKGEPRFYQRCRVNMPLLTRLRRITANQVKALGLAYHIRSAILDLMAFPHNPLSNYHPSVFSTQVFWGDICMRPNKHAVHFLDPRTNEVVYPDEIPPTPSPSFSINSLPSSPLPPTPSSSGLRFRCVSLPQVETCSQIPQVNPAISYDGMTMPVLQLDVTVGPPRFSKYSPPSAERSPLTGHTPSQTTLDHSLLSELAVFPPMDSIKLISNQFPWFTEVRSSVNGVTLFDIWQTLHDKLRTPISKGEWSMISQAQQAFVSKAFYLRVEQIPDSTLKEKQHRKGVRRLDFLFGHTKLLGITAVPDKPGNFNLHWGLPPPASLPCTPLSSPHPWAT